MRQLSLITLLFVTCASTACGPEHGSSVAAPSPRNDATASDASHGDPEAPVAAGPVPEKSDLRDRPAVGLVARACPAEQRVEASEAALRYIENIRRGRRAPASEVALNALAHVYDLRIHLFSRAGVADWVVQSPGARREIYLLNTGGHWVVATPHGEYLANAGAERSCCWALAARKATTMYYPNMPITDSLTRMRERTADVLCTSAWLPDVEVQALDPGD